ncbi:MAG TPA: tetratricopeptide repeat protein [Thermoanaerobaculia bacterium]|nr:tetratricopeptide repeat protein [Thermoanaerobaculia bacterium]
MPQPSTNPKIEELRFRIKTDPKSRLFYPLAEELRKASQFGEAEQVLRAGLTSHPTYLSAWVGLGRVLRDQGKNAEAAEALSKALGLDPGNVVAARLLAESYLSLGEKVEAIKKYKLVHALLPADEEVEAIIARLDAEINAPALPPEPMEIPEARAGEDTGVPTDVAPMQTSAPADTEPESDADVFDVTYSKLRKGLQVDMQDDLGTGDADPMLADHAESPFEEPAADLGYSADAFAIEQPEGLHVAPGFIQGSFQANVAPAPPEPDDFARTITMADLYANQGLIDEARDIYEDILARDPDNAGVRAKLDALSGTPVPPPALEESAGRSAGEDTGASTRNPKIDKLEGWLSRVKRKEAGSV